jgi:DNA-directed RNA polymerase
MLDGTCSGLQHWAALLRDEKIGEFVNLLPSDAPKDLYAKVATRAEAAMQEAIVQQEPWPWNGTHSVSIGA